MTGADRVSLRSVDDETELQDWITALPPLSLPSHGVAAMRDLGGWRIKAAALLRQLEWSHREAQNVRRVLEARLLRTGEIRPVIDLP